MLTPSLIYIAVTVLLALVDAIRIKVKWGKVSNIDHGLSYRLAAYSGLVVLTWWYFTYLTFNWWTLLGIVIVSLSFVGVRFAFYDFFLNIFRLLLGINPTLRLDYVSTETSSYEDQHSEKVGFWWKRVIGVAGFFAMYFLYRLIFKV